MALRSMKTVPTNPVSQNSEDEFPNGAVFVQPADDKRGLALIPENHRFQEPNGIWIPRRTVESMPCIAAQLHYVSRSWAFWMIVLSSILFAWDPLQIREMVAISQDYHFVECPKPGIECCRSAPDVNQWPTDPANKLLASEFFATTENPAPESLAWDLQGRGPYTGLADGRVVRWNDHDGSFENFAYVSPYWSEELCASTRQDTKLKLELEHSCGRPLGLKFHPISGELFIADAYFGLAMVGRAGGQAELLTNQTERAAHKFTNDLDIHNDGTVYFTVSSMRRQRRECNVVVMEGESTGRLIKYDPKMKRSSVLLRDLRYPNGIAISEEGDFLLIALTSSNRVMRYWLQGPKVGDLEEFADLPGYPDNVHSTDSGDFWVALHGRRTSFQVWLCRTAWASSVMFPLHQKFKTVQRILSRNVTPMAIKYNRHGDVIDVLEDRTKTSHTQFLSTALERGGKLWLSSVYSPIISFYELQAPQYPLLSFYTVRSDGWNNSVDI